MAWRLAKSLIVLFNEYDRAYPGRDKASDGTLGNAAHRRGWESSDHNPWVKDGKGTGVVRAGDFDAGKGLTPSESADGPGDDLLADLLRAGKADHPALGTGSYIIYEGYFYSRANGWKQRRYNGPNKHHSHVHVSVGRNQHSYDSTQAWGVAAKKPAVKAPAKSAEPDAPSLSKLKPGADNSAVRELQQRLAKLGYNPGPVDGIYGAKTKAAVTAFQKAQGWSGKDVDGIVGPVTLKRMF